MKTRKGGGQQNAPELYIRRFYRETPHSVDLSWFEVKREQTDLLIGVTRGSSVGNPFLKQLAEKTVFVHRQALEAHIRRQPLFLSSLVPVPRLPDEAAIVRRMNHAAEIAGVGPMAAVAGAFSALVGETLKAHVADVLVENGGDLYMAGQKERIVGVFAATSPFSGKVGVRILPGDMPCGVCTSSATIGHSLSLGRADAALVLAADAALADAAATHLGNRIHHPEDMDAAMQATLSLPGVKGVLTIMGESMGAAGNITLCEL